MPPMARRRARKLLALAGGTLCAVWWLSARHPGALDGLAGRSITSATLTAAGKPPDPATTIIIEDAADPQCPCHLRTRRLHWSADAEPAGEKLRRTQMMYEPAAREVPDIRLEETHAPIGAAVLLCSAERAATAVAAAAALAARSSSAAALAGSGKRLLDVHIFSVCDADQAVRAQLRRLGATGHPLPGGLWLHDVTCACGGGGGAKLVASTGSASSDSESHRQKLAKAREDYHSVFVTMFRSFGYNFTAFVEDDLAVSPALPGFFSKSVESMRMDPSLYCASGWNDNSFGGQTAGPPPDILRGQHFMGLGWLMPRSRFESDVWPLWARRSESSGGDQPFEAWDQILQRAMPAGAECLYPTIALTHHLRKAGAQTIHSEGHSMQATFDAMSFWQEERLGRPASQNDNMAALTKPHYHKYLRSLIANRTTANTAASAAVRTVTTCVVAAGPADAAWDRALHKISARLVGVGNGGVPRGFHAGTVLVSVGGGVQHFLVAVDSPFFSAADCSRYEMPAEIRPGQCIPSGGGALVDGADGRVSLQLEPLARGALSVRRCGGSEGDPAGSTAPKYAWVGGGGVGGGQGTDADGQIATRRLCLSQAGQLAVWRSDGGSGSAASAWRFGAVDADAWVLEAELHPAWNSSGSKQAEASGSKLVMQTDGNAVLYSGSGEAAWASNWMRAQCEGCERCVACAAQAGQLCS
eukprot:SAG22_NODE_1886_length_3375_cov_2.928877_2_plen_700_part_00